MFHRTTFLLCEISVKSNILFPPQTFRGSLCTKSDTLRGFNGFWHQSPPNSWFLIS